MITPLELHPEVYDCFYKQNQIVTSVPIPIRLLGCRRQLGYEIAAPHSRAVYCGFALNDSAKITLNRDLNCFRSQKAGFHLIQIIEDQYNCDALVAYIEDFLKKSKGYKGQGVQINFLYEVSLSEGLMASYEPFLQALAINLLLLSGECKESDFDAMLADTEWNFLNEHPLGKRIQEVCIGMSEVYTNIENLSCALNPPRILRDDWYVHDRNNYLNTKLCSDLFNGNHRAPLDYIVIAPSNQLPNTSHHDWVTKQNIQAHQLTLSDLFYPEKEKKPETHYRDFLLAGIANHTASILSAAYDQDSPIHPTQTTLHRIKQYNYFLQSFTKDLEPHSHFQFFQNHPHVAYLHASYYIPKCSYTLFSEYGYLRDNYQDIVASALAIDPHCSVIHTSWEEPINLDPFKIHQYGLDTVSEEQLQIHNICGASSEIVCVSLQELPDHTNEAVVFDNLHHKISINGELVDSAHIKSQRFTTEVLALIARSESFKAHSGDLPRGSYSDDINSFRSKIATPLNKLLEASGINLELHASAHNDGRFITWMSGSDKYLVIQ